MAKREKDILLGHSDEADGIEEYDNALPTWWLGMLYLSIIWAVGYAVHYHFIGDRSQVGAYNAEVAAAEIKWPKAEIVVGDDALSGDAVSQGEEIYKTNCVACHGAELLGGIGPNLIDEEWVHGGSLLEITKTVTDGVPAKGMLSWGPILGEDKVAQVSAFVYSRSHPDEVQ